MENQQNNNYGNQSMTLNQMNQQQQHPQQNLPPIGSEFLTPKTTQISG